VLKGLSAPTRNASYGLVITKKGVHEVEETPGNKKQAAHDWGSVTAACSRINLCSSILPGKTRKRKED